MKFESLVVIISVKNSGIKTPDHSIFRKRKT